MPFTSKIMENGSRNAKVLFTGIVESNFGPIEIIDLDILKCAAVKMESALWIVQEKMGLRLWWGKGEMTSGYPEPTIDNLLFVMESRNGARFDHGIDSPRTTEKWDRKIWMDSFGFSSNELTPKHFTFILEFDKQ